MDRRRFLVACAGSLAVAGCTGDSDYSEGSTPSPTPSSADQGDAAEAQQHLDAAYNEFEDAWETFQEEFESFDENDERVSFDSEVIDARLDRSEDELDDAEPLANTDQQTTIDAFRDVLNWSRSTVSTFGYFANAIDDYFTATTYWENERFEDAATRFSDAVDDLDEADSELTVARSRFESFNLDAFDEYDEIRGLELELAMEEMDSLISDFDYLSRGLHHLALGFGPFQSAAEAFDNENYSEASDGFAEARDEFSTANSIITEGEESASDDLIDDFIGLSCMTGSVRDAADHYNSASEAAENGNWSQAEEDVDNAERALERCDYEV